MISQNILDIASKLDEKASKVLIDNYSVIDPEYQVYVTGAYVTEQYDTWKDADIPVLIVELQGAGCKIHQEVYPL